MARTWPFAGTAPGTASPYVLTEGKSCAELMAEHNTETAPATSPATTSRRKRYPSKPSTMAKFAEPLPRRSFMPSWYSADS